VIENKRKREKISESGIFIELYESKAVARIYNSKAVARIYEDFRGVRKLIDFFIKVQVDWFRPF